ncbi:MAG TPA: CapA family protein [Desulfosporosinus sp.]|nr:CapA family protein [Desulfosporosinus sp.]
MFNRFLAVLITCSCIFGSSAQVMAADKNTDFVEIQQIIPSVVLDIKYATTDNFTHNKLYNSSSALLRQGTADKLKLVADEVEKKGYQLKLWDAYRSPDAQFKMWNLVPDTRYVANPYKGYSNHSRGSAVDVTLIDLQGNEIPMPTGYDDFIAAAARANENVNATYLQTVMLKHGFKKLATEWWHFDDQDSYKPADSAQVRADPAALAALEAPQIPVFEVLDRATKATLTIGAVGDVTLGQDERFSYAGSFNETYKLHGAGYFFSRVQKVLSEDDLTLANLEGTLTEASEKPDKSAQGNQAFFFKGNPYFTEILKEGSIEAVNLANNHSMDYLTKGFTNTVSTLDHAGISSFGDNKLAVFEKNGVKIGLIGVNTLGPLEEGVNSDKLKSDLTDNIQTLKEKTSLIIVSFHWGTENKSTVNQGQRDLGRFAVDMGADLVLGHHPHIIQPYEMYRGKCIVYSLGNFVFGGNSNPWNKETDIFQQKFSFVDGRLVNGSAPVIIPCHLSSRFRPEPLK